MTSSLSANRKRKIDQAIEDGTVPYSKKSKGLLQTGPKSFITLASAQGGATENGKYWTENSGQDLPSATANLSQPYVQFGSSEYIIDSSGKRRLLRTYKSEQKEYKYTRLGRQYFAANKLAYTVDIQVNIEGHVTNPDFQHTIPGLQS